MIPRVIHYCWFGKNPLPDLAIKCIDSWKKFLPEYEVVLWNERNFDINACPYIYEAYSSQCWAFVSDYVRLKVIYDHGGIYLDTDVEVIKPFDELLDCSCFLGTEDSGYINTGVGFGAEKGNIAVQWMLEKYDGIHFVDKHGRRDTTPCPIRNTLPFWEKGFRYDKNSIWKYNGIVVYPPEFFSPKSNISPKHDIRITEKTYSIHHYSASWVTEEERKKWEEIDRIKAENSKAIGKLKIHQYLYKEMKKKGEVMSIADYILIKVKKRLRTTFLGYK